MPKKLSRAAARRKAERRSKRKSSSSSPDRANTEAKRPEPYVLSTQDSLGRRVVLLATALALPISIFVVFYALLNMSPGPMISITTVIGCLYYAVKSAEWEWAEPAQRKWLRRYCIYLTRHQWIGLIAGLALTIGFFAIWKRDALRTAPEYQINDAVFLCCIWVSLCFVVVLKISVDYVEIPDGATPLSSLDKAIGPVLNGFQISLVAAALQLFESHLVDGTLNQNWRPPTLLGLASLILACAVASGTTNYQGVHRFRVPSWHLLLTTSWKAVVAVGTIAGIGAAVGALVGAANWWLQDGPRDQFLKFVGDSATLATFGGAALGLMTFPVSAIKRVRSLNSTIPRFLPGND